MERRRRRRNKVDPNSHELQVQMEGEPPEVALPADVKLPPGYETELRSLRREKTDHQRLESIRKMAFPMAFKKYLK